MTKSNKLLRVLAATFIILSQLANVNCQQCNFNNGTEGHCRNGTYELWHVLTNGKRSVTACCHPNTDDASRMEIAASAEGCTAAPCVPQNVSDSCKILPNYIVNKKSLKYKDTFRENCSNSAYPSGYMAYCCRPGSLEEALVSTLGAEASEFPHQAAVSIDGAICGGTIFNKRYILTAAHCVVDPTTRRVMPINNGQRYKITVGRNLRTNDSPQNIYGVEKVIVHEEYSKIAGSAELKKLATGEYEVQEELRTYNDIALLRLDRDISFGNNVKALRLAEKGFNPVDHAKTVVITGWGTSESGRAMEHLQKANFDIVSDDRCFGIPEYSKFWEFRDKLLCFGGIVDGKWSSGVGKGDSGGPAICRDGNGKPVLCGITSFSIGGINCVTDQTEDSCYPGVFVEVSKYRDWVESHVPEGQDEDTIFDSPLYGMPTSALHQVRVISANGKSCGGTLIQPDIVVTAAQCVMYDDSTMLKDIKVKTSQGQTIELAGSPAVMPGFKKHPKPNIPAENTKAGVKRVVMYDNFYANDLAILRLQQSVPGVRADQLPRLPERSEMPQGAAVELSVSRDNPEKGLLQRTFNILDKADCQKRMNRLEIIKLKTRVSNKIVCGVEQYSGGSQCERELGGGLICKGNVLCGVQSFRLCEWSLPNFFVDMSQQKSFVEKAIAVLRRN